MTEDIEDVEAAPSADAVPLDKLVAIHAKIKAKQEMLDKQLAELEEQRTEVRMAIKDQMKALGLKSVQTSHGTVSLVHKTRYTTQDWDSFKRFIIEHDAVDLLEKRIAQLNMRTFLEENPALVPPGLNSDTEFDVSVRKPTK